MSIIRYDRVRFAPDEIIFASHIAVVGGRSAPGQAIAFVVGAHAVKSAATGELSLEMIDA